MGTEQKFGTPVLNESEAFKPVDGMKSYIWGHNLIMKGKGIPTNIMRSPLLAEAKRVGLERFGPNLHRADIGQPLDKDLPIHDLIRKANQYATEMEEKYPALRNYTDPDGLHAIPEIGFKGIRESLADFYDSYFGLPINPESVLMGNGASEMWNAFVNTQLMPGDMIIAADPHYNPFDVTLAQAGVGWLPVKTKAENGYHPTETDLSDSLKNKPAEGRIKAVYLNSPSNPTGAVYNKQELDMMVDLALRNDLFIIMDSVYSLYNYSDNPTLVDYLRDLPDAKREKVYEKLVLLESMSKLAHIPGTRIGMGIVPNKELRGQMLSNLGMLGNRQNHGQLKAAYMLDELTKKPSILDDQRELYRQKMDIFYDEVRLKLMDTGIIDFSPKPEGGLYLSLKTKFESTEQFLLWSMNNLERSDATTFVPLATQTGSFRVDDFDEAKHELRLCIGVDIEDIQGTVDAFVDQIIQYSRFLQLSSTVTKTT
jgi:aspartate aminotransferase